MQGGSTFFVQAFTHSAWPKELKTLCMPVRSTKKWKIANLKKVRMLIFTESGAFFQLCKIPHQSGPNFQESADTSSKEVL
jgi:hypothetical protein